MVPLVSLNSRILEQIWRMREQKWKISEQKYVRSSKRMFRHPFRVVGDVNQTVEIIIRSKLTDESF